MTRTAGPAASAGLGDPRVREVLDELFATAEKVDAEVLRRAYATAAQWAQPPTPAQTSELCAEAGLPVHRDVGRLLYQLVRAVRPALVVEFGTSFGASAIHLAAAVRENGTGRVIGSELHPGKAAQARRNLERAGLLDRVEVVEGDALETLRDLPGPVDLLLLDGWKELYLPVLRTVEPALRDGALVVSDNLPMLPEAFLERVRGSGYVSQSLALGDGVELSVRTGPPSA